MFRTARRAIGIFFVAVFLLFFFTDHIFAQVQVQQGQLAGWEPDSEVTSVGKSAARAQQFLDWTLDADNAKWVFLTPDSSVNQIAVFWSNIRNIAYVLTIATVLITAFLIIITRGQRFNAKKQVLGIAAVLILITFSFALIDFFYRLVDTLQIFFLRLPGNPISSQDLLHVGFNYEDFVGLRQPESVNDEAANVALFLIKATAITYYVMAGILLFRKIILWFFIILSPLWVLLLPFPLIRNTAKIWMGEFFRWLFYGPLFALLLAGLVQMWQQFNIPLDFTTTGRGAGQGGPLVYPTAISILLGGPGEIVSTSNSLNNIDTYAKYIVALLMLWVVILLPFLLLKVFRDALTTMFKDENTLFQRALGSLYPFLGRPAVPTIPQTPTSGEGLARELSLHRSSDNTREVNLQTQAGGQMSSIADLPQVRTTDIVKYAGIMIPTLRDVARMEVQRDTISLNQVALRNIANPTSIPSTHERSRFSSIQQELLTRSKRGDVAATTILAAAETARTGKPTPIIAAVRPMPARTGQPHQTDKPSLMPLSNRIQTVGIDDYEDVKKMWEESYREGDVPINDTIKSRLDWIEKDIAKIATIIELLSSANEEEKKKGLEELSVILPFLLLGGFSQQETTVYLKAKLEAAKKVLSELEKTSKEQDEQIFVAQKTQESQNEKESQSAISLTSIQESTTKPPVTESGLPNISEKKT